MSTVSTSLHRRRSSKKEDLILEAASEAPLTPKLKPTTKKGSLRRSRSGFLFNFNKVSPESVKAPRSVSSPTTLKKENLVLEAASEAPLTPKLKPTTKKGPLRRSRNGFRISFSKILSREQVSPKLSKYHAEKSTLGDKDKSSDKASVPDYVSTAVSPLMRHHMMPATRTQTHTEDSFDNEFESVNDEKDDEKKFSSTASPNGDSENTKVAVGGISLTENSLILSNEKLTIVGESNHNSVDDDDDDDGGANEPLGPPPSLDACRESSFIFEPSSFGNSSYRRGSSKASVAPATTTTTDEQTLTYLESLVFEPRPPECQEPRPVLPPSYSYRSMLMDRDEISDYIDLY